MKGIPSELLLLLLFGAFLLFNAVMQRAARKRQGEAAPDEPSPQDLIEDIEALARPTPVAAPARRATATRAAPALGARRRYSRQSLFGDRRRAQEAFVVATILGRCRADEPHQPG